MGPIHHIAQGDETTANFSAACKRPMVEPSPVPSLQWMATSTTTTAIFVDMAMLFDLTRRSRLQVFAAEGKIPMDATYLV